MQTNGKNSRADLKATVAILLTVVAGIVDIVGYLTVYHSFVAHMTGATVHLGSNLVRSNWADATKAAVTIGSFVAGSLIGRGTIEFAARRRKRTAATATLLAEVVLVMAFVGLSVSVPFPAQPDALSLKFACLLLALLAAAMGLQTATLTRIGPLTIHTTFVTGMLNKLAQALSHWLFWLYDGWREQRNWRHFLNSGHHVAFRNARFMTLIWLAYMSGAVAGSWMHARWKSAGLIVPVVVLVICAGIDQRQPLSLEEEHDQA